MESDKSSPLRLPTLESLPKGDATLEEMIHFAHSTDPTAHFHDRWGNEYKGNIQALWRECFQSYKAGDVATGTPGELLMCFVYDVILGPYSGVPEPHKLLFLRWLLEGIRRGLEVLYVQE